MCVPSSDHTLRLQDALSWEKFDNTISLFLEFWIFVGALAYGVIDKNYSSISAIQANATQHFGPVIIHIVRLISPKKKKNLEHDVEDAAANRYRAHSYISAYECVAACTHARFLSKGCDRN